jgi:hypothetical protein
MKLQICNYYLIISNNNIKAMIEISRISVFILILLFYFTSQIGYVAGLTHLMLVLWDRKKYGISMVVNKIISSVYRRSIQYCNFKSVFYELM